MSTLPRYKCHKIVEAIKIRDIIILNHDHNRLVPENWNTFDDVKVSKEWYSKYKPEAGGYYVRYEDGYESYSPAEAFEKGYKRLVVHDSKEFVEAECLEYIVRRFKEVEANQMQIEVIISALEEMKADPSISVQTAFCRGCDEWDI